MDNCKVRKLKFSLVMLRNVSLKTICHNMACGQNCFQKSLHPSQHGPQCWEFAHSLIAHLLICSDHSDQMRNCEQFAQIAQDK